MSAPKRVELITTGDELLLGLTANSHLGYLGDQLRRRGAMLTRNVVIADDAMAIGVQFRESWSRSDVVITTGGLGPTCDDRTREVIANALGQKLIHDPAIERAIRDRFARMNWKMSANNLRQAQRPERSDVLENPHGTAPGLWVEQDGRILVMLPGPPNELVPMFETHVLPRLAARGILCHEETYVQIRTAGVGESALETMLQAIFAEYPGVGVAFCAHPGHVDVRLSSPCGALTRTQLQILGNRCRERLGMDFVCFGHDPLVKIVSDLLRLRDLDLAVAESCTGGSLASAFTDQPGASKFFAGGVVCYSNDCKVQLLDIPECMLKQHGAVSAEVAVAMATGVAERLSADYGLAITGFAGPCGGNQDNPVGTIYFGLHSPHGVWSRRITVPGPRLSVKQRAVTIALDWLRRELIRAQAHESQIASDEPHDEPARKEARRFMGFGGCEM